MSRRSTNTVDYFPHSAKSGKTLAILEGRYGVVGYAFWFKLLESLCTSEGHYIDCGKPETWEYLVSTAHTDEATANEMMALLSRLGNIDRELWEKGRVVWCPALVENIKDAYRNRRRPVPEKPKLPVETQPMGGVSTEKKGDIAGRSTEIKTKQIKTKQSKDTAVAARVETNPLYHVVEQAFLSRNGDKFTNYGKEGKAIHGLIDKATARMPDDPGAMMHAMLDAFWKLKTGDTSAKGFWRGQPFLPSALSPLWDRVLETMREDVVDPEILAIVNGGKA